MRRPGQRRGLIPVVVIGVLLGTLTPARGQAERALHLSPEELAALDEAVSRGVSWLLEGQAESGAFAPRVRADACPVALTAMALWAAASSETLPEDNQRLHAAARYLMDQRQDDDGIYDPRRGLAVYTSGVAARALAELHRRAPADELHVAAYAAELFSYRRATPESLVDDAQSTGTARDHSPELARELLSSGNAATDSERGALEFLAGFQGDDVRRRPLRTRDPRWTSRGSELDGFSYEDLLPFVYRPLKAEHQSALRAIAAIRQHYTLDRNPDLTRRFGDGGFQREHDGLFYYYLTVAKALSIQARPLLATVDGQRHDWVRELSSRLLSLQASDGHWVNDSSGWWEDEPVLVTSYAVLALGLCRGMEAR